LFSGISAESSWVLKERGSKPVGSLKTTHTVKQFSESIGLKPQFMETSKNLISPNSSTSTSSPADSLAKTSRSLEKEKEWLAREVAYGASSPVLLAKFDHVTSLWKTFQTSLTLGLNKSLQILPEQGMIRNILCSVQVVLVPFIEEKEFLSLLRGAIFDEKKVTFRTTMRSLWKIFQTERGFSEERAWEILFNALLWIKQEDNAECFQRGIGEIVRSGKNSNSSNREKVRLWMETNLSEDEGVWDKHEIWRLEANDDLRNLLALRRNEGKDFSAYSECGGEVWSKTNQGGNRSPHRWESTEQQEGKSVDTNENESCETPQSIGQDSLSINRKGDGNLHGRKWIYYLNKIGGGFGCEIETNLYALPNLAPYTGEKEYSLLPTITTADTWNSNLKSTQTKPNSKHSLNSIPALERVLSGTMVASNRIRSPKHHVGRLFQPQELVLLPTIGATEYKGTSRKRLQGSLDFHSSKMSEGLRTCSTDPTYLNPFFATKIMGFPLGWAYVEAKPKPKRIKKK